jgi:hypothetical protein
MSSVKQVQTKPNQTRLISIIFSLSHNQIILRTSEAPTFQFQYPGPHFLGIQTGRKPIKNKKKKKKKKQTMGIENTKDLASVDAPHLSDTMRVTKNHTDLRRCQTFLRKLANALLNLKTHSPIESTSDGDKNKHTLTDITQRVRFASVHPEQRS